jgi:large subunit ribosomal protein L4
LYATNTRADEDDEAQKKNQGGDEDDGKNNVTRRSVTNIIVRPKSAVDLEQGEMRDKTVPIHASTHIIEEKESSFDEKIVLPGRHFDIPIRIDIAHRCVRWQLARKRGVSTAKTKSRGEVSGTTRKARPQKGGGRARVGSLRAPQMRGGGTAHGPIPRDFEHKLQKKVRRLGLRVALSAKAAEGRLVVVEDLKWMSPTGKTKEAKFGLKQLLRYDDSSEEEDELNHMRLSPSPLVIGGTGDSGNKINTKFSALVVGDRLETTDESDDGWLLRRGTRNIENIHVMPSVGLNVYSILKHRCLVMTKKAVEELVERLDKPINR